jgi:hypothetical protein
LKTLLKFYKSINIWRGQVYDVMFKENLAKIGSKERIKKTLGFFM